MCVLLCVSYCHRLLEPFRYSIAAKYAPLSYFRRRAITVLRGDVRSEKPASWGVCCTRDNLISHVITKIYLSHIYSAWIKRHLFSSFSTSSTGKQNCSFSFWFTLSLSGAMLRAMPSCWGGSRFLLQSVRFSDTYRTWQLTFKSQWWYIRGRCEIKLLILKRRRLPNDEKCVTS